MQFNFSLILLMMQFRPTGILNGDGGTDGTIELFVGGDVHVEKNGCNYAFDEQKNTKNDEYLWVVLNVDV